MWYVQDLTSLQQDKHLKAHPLSVLAAWQTGSNSVTSALPVTWTQCARARELSAYSRKLQNSISPLKESKCMTARPKPEPGSGEADYSRRKAMQLHRRVLLKIMASRHMSIKKELEAPSAWGRCRNV